MKLKKLLSFALALAMVAAFIPAFTLTVSAASYTSDYLVDNADYTFTYGDIGTATWQNVYFGSETAEGTNWAGWTSDSTNLRLYKISQTFIAADACDTGTAMILTASSDVQTNTAGKDYIVVEWTGNDAQSYCNNSNWFDVAYADSDGVFDTFRYFKKGYTSDLGPGIHWDWGDGWAGNTYSNCFANLAKGYTYEGNSSYGTIGSSADYTLYRMVYANDEDGDGYTASYYYNDNGTSGNYQLIGTKTFAEGTVSNFTSMQIGGYVPNDIRIDYFKIYAGTYPASTETVTINYQVGGTTVYSDYYTYSTTAASGYTFDEYYYSPGNGSNVLYYTAATTVSNGETETIEMTALENAGNYATNDTVTVDGEVYTIQGSNIVPNGDFEHGMNGWYSRANTTPPTNYSVTTSDVPSGVTRAALSSGNNGAGSTNSIGRGWAIESGTTYYYSLWVKAGDEWHGMGQTDTIESTSATDGRTADPTDIVGNGGFGTSGTWVQTTGVFTATNAYVMFFEGWSSVGVAEVEIYPVVKDEDASVNVTVKYSTDGTENGVIDDLTYTTSVVKGSSIETTAISNYVYNGKYYSADSETVAVDADATEDVTTIVTLTVDTSIYAPTSDFSYNFYTGEVCWAGDNGYTSSDKKATISIGWNNYRQTIMTYDIDVEANQLVTGATLNVYVGYANNASSPYTVYAIDASLVDTTTPEMTPQITGYTWSDRSTVLSLLDATEVGSATVTRYAWNTVTLDLSGVDLSSGTLALLISSSYQVYTESTATSNAPYLSNIETTTAVTYTVEYLDTAGSALDTDLNADGDATGTYSTTYDNTLGYDDEIVCDYVTIPYFTGYVFKSKSVSGSTITLTYEATDTDAYFFADADDDATIISLNMLGAHDAFTANVDDVKYDAAGIATGDTGSIAFRVALGSSTVVNSSKAQSADTLTLLNSGVRYFDVRVSRSTEDVTYAYLYDTPHTNGVFYTTHGGLSDEFRPIAYTIGQWLKEHPGEIVMLNFHSAFEDGGSATTDTWNAINDILDEAGINDFASIKNSTAGSGNLASATIASYTDDRSHAGVLIFGQATAANNSIGNFILNETSTDLFTGRVYSNYDQSATISTSGFDPEYIQDQIDYQDTFTATNTTSDDITAWLVRVMQAQSETSNLISQAASDNTAVYNALISEDTSDYTYSEWLTRLPIIMVNDAVTNTDDLLTLLAECNKAKEVTVNYTTGSGDTITATKQLMVGTIYTQDQYALVHVDDTNYYADYAYTTVPSTCGTSSVTYVPYNGSLTIPVTEITDSIYSIGYRTYASNVSVSDGGVLYGSASGVGSGGNSNPAFAAYNWSTLDNTDRVGVAIFTAPTASAIENYTLDVTNARDYSTGGLNTYFYIVLLSEYNTVDISDSAALETLFTEDNLIATYSNANNNDNTAGYTYSFELDKTTIDKYAGQDVVILGTSSGGLYGLSSITIGTTEMDFGVTLVSGAQIRVGDGVDEDDKVIAENSGLRFIAIVNNSGTIAAEAETLDGTDLPNVGIAIFDGAFSTTEFDAADAETTYSGKTPLTMIAAEKYQDDDNTVFTAAIVNLAETSYNRVYVAVPYAVVGTTTYYNWDAAVARSPYQVAAGILTSTDTVSGYDQTAESEKLYDVLNAYANQTGARITLTYGTETLFIVDEADYANNAAAFFTATISDEADADGYYTITLTASGDNTKFYDYAKTYYRVNNAKSTSFETRYSIETDTDVEISEDGTVMTIKFIPGE